MSRPLLLTTDELQAGARLVGAGLPPVLAAGDADHPRVDLAALRGLAARGLIAGLAQHRPEPVGALARALAVLESPTLVVEAEHDAGGSPPSPPERWAVVARPGETAHLSLRPGGLVDVTVVDGDPAAVVRSGCRLDAVAAATPAGAGWEAAAAAHADSDELALAGDPAGAVAVLVGAGVDADAAGAWVAAVRGRRGATALRAARLLPDGGAVEVRDLRWLVDGSGRAWRVDAGPSPAGAGDEESDGATTLVRPVGAGALRAAVEEVARCSVSSGSSPG